MRGLHGRRARVVRPYWKVLLKTVLPISFFAAFFLVILIGGLWNAVYAPFGSLVCDGTPAVNLVSYSRPGEGGIAMDFLCVAADGSSTENMGIMAVSLIGYTLVFFAALALIALLARRSMGVEAGRPVPDHLDGYFGGEDAPLSPMDRATVRTAATRRDITLTGREADEFLEGLSGLIDGSDITARTSETIDLSDADLDTKLRTVAGLRAQGLIDDETYQAIVAKIREKG